MATNFNKGVAKLVSNSIVGDEGFKSALPEVEYVSSLLSKLVGGKLLIQSFMENNFSMIYEELAEYGISSEQFNNIVNSINEINGGEKIVETLKGITDLFTIKISNGTQNGKITLNNAVDEIDTYTGLLCDNSNTLYAVYPGAPRIPEAERLKVYTDSGLGTLKSTLENTLNMGMDSISKVI